MIKYIYSIITIALLLYCKSPSIGNDTYCLKQINKIISKELRKEFDSNYDFILKKMEWKS